jgi:AraC-like DNA-binding protein
MRIVRSAAVAPALKEYVRAYAQREFTWTGTAVVQPVPASLECVINFEFRSPSTIDYIDGTRAATHRVTVVGCHTFRRAWLRLDRTVETFAIFFTPLGLWQLLRIPNAELVNRSFDGTDVVGGQIHELWQQFAAARSFEERVCIAERYLAPLAARAQARTPVMDAAQRLFTVRSPIRIDELARDSGLSLRQFERRFITDVGMVPKVFARITRFQTALDSKLRAPHRSWVEIAQAGGYHDQMHMIHEFVRLSGASPAKILPELGDIRPPALVAADGESNRTAPGAPRDVPGGGKRARCRIFTSQPVRP